MHPPPPSQQAIVLASRALARIMADKRPGLAWTPDPDLTPLHHQGEGRAERPEAETLPAALTRPAGTQPQTAQPRRAA